MLLAPHVTALTLNIVVVLVLVAVAASDRVYGRQAAATPAGAGNPEGVR
jgi:hypothetical protein